jgi:DNA-binding MarR family transcriptional regulator
MYDRELRGTGLEPTQYSLLMALDIKGETSQGELGTLLALDSTTLTRMLRPLMKSGWIAERPGVDRRQRLLRLAAGGRLKLKQSLSHWERAQRQLQNRLGEPAWSQMGMLLAQVTQASLKE